MREKSQIAQKYILFNDIPSKLLKNITKKSPLNFFSFCQKIKLNKHYTFMNLTNRFVNISKTVNI